MKQFVPYLYIPAGIYLAWMVRRFYRSGVIAGSGFRISRQATPFLFLVILAICVICVFGFWVVGIAMVLRQAALDGILF
jgi:hypothetical protein